MRKIKFRAWDKILNKMLMWDEIKMDSFVISEYHDAFHLMQYTGLKDNSNLSKEIYEGDIVREKTGELRVVVWYLAGFYFKYVKPKGDPDTKINTISLEVIGNIYENPELLGEK